MVGEAFLRQSKGRSNRAAGSFGPWWDARGRMTPVVATDRDQTEQRRLQEALAVGLVSPFKFGTMTIFLTGASGLVGSVFVQAATRRGHRVVGVVGTYVGEIEGLAAKRTVDLTDDTTTSAAVLDAFPDAIVNCAAVSVPAQCEADPARAQAMNVALPALLARLAHHVSARFVHISSSKSSTARGRHPTPRTTARRRSISTRDKNWRVNAPCRRRPQTLP